MTISATKKLRKPYLISNMIYPAKADIILLVKCIVKGLQPYAQVNQVNLTFHCKSKQLIIQYEPFDLIQSLTKLLCFIINLIPPQSAVKVKLLHDPEMQQLVLEIENTGINLIYINGSMAKTMYAFTASPLEKGTLYRLTLSSQQAVLPEQVQKTNDAAPDLPQFYAEIRKRLHSHFTQSEKILASIARTRPQEAAFLQKINALIKANLEDEDFDTNALCKAMAISRTQLFRRLKPLIRQAPATYIKILRLQRAKELLETTEFTVSEVAFKTGFQTLSHFTKIFQQQYGLLPSAFRRKNKPATNE